MKHTPHNFPISSDHHRYYFSEFNRWYKIFSSSRQPEKSIKRTATPRRGGSRGMANTYVGVRR